MEQKNSISNYIANLHEMHIHFFLNLHYTWNCDHSQLKYFKWSIYAKTYHNSKLTSGYFFPFIKDIYNFSQLLNSVQHFVSPWTTTHQASLSIINSWSLPKLMSIESVMPSKHLILCHPLLLLPSIFPSIRVISDESALLMRWPEYWSFSFSNSPSNEHPGLISFRMDWLDLLAVQGTPKSLLQLHSSKHQFFSAHFSL